MTHFPSRTITAAVLALALGTASCSSPNGDLAAASTGATTTTSSSTTTSTTSTTSTTTTPPTTAAPAPLDIGTLERRLAELHFDAGKVDGVFDAATGHAVMAFQKTHGLERNGKASADLIEKVKAAGDPEPMMPSGGANRVEVDLKRQVLLLYRDGALLRILSVSTGNNKRYCVDGDCATAVTPGGSYKITRRIKGLRVSRLGKLYNPLYFNGGIAIHGAPSVPAYPASHGCVRIPMHTSAWFYDTVPNGTPVYVLGGKKAPVPFNEQAPAEDQSTSPTTSPSTTTSPPAPTTSTTAPTSTTTTPTSTTTTTSPTSTTTTSTTSTTVVGTT